MPIVYSNAIKDARLEIVVDALSGGGEIVIGTSALSGSTGVLVRLPLDTGVATVSAGVMTLTGVPLSATATGAGTAALAELRDATNTVVASGLTVGSGGGNNIVINATAISVGQTVQISTGTITHG